MKSKLLLGMTLACLLSTNSFSLEITHGKLLSHKEWTTGNVKAVSQEAKHLQIPELQLPPHKLNNTRYESDWVDVMTTEAWYNPPLGAQIPANRDISLYGVSAVAITNSTSAPVTYTIATSLNVCEQSQIPGSLKLCWFPSGSSISQDVVTLDAHGSLTLQNTPMATINSSYPELVTYWVDSSVTREGGTTAFSSRSSANYLIIEADNKSN
jgi:hypothetical protein